MASMGSAMSSLRGGQRRRRQNASKRATASRLATSRLKFTDEHLTQVTARLLRLEAESAEAACDLASRRAQSVMEGAVERLVQRLVTGVGSLDQRFASKYLVRLPSELRLQEPSVEKCFAYLVRIDALSSPALYPEANSSEPIICLTEAAPSGCARLKLNTKRDLVLWKEFLTDEGLLRRDKIQEKFVELLARSASLPSDCVRDRESLLCLSAGKVVDAGLLHRLIHTPPETHIYYGSDASGSTCDPRNFRLAIVEGAGEVRLRVGLISPTLGGHCGDVEVELVLGVEMNLWPHASDFPTRIPLYHPDALMYYQLMNTGCYAVSGAPPLAMRRGGVGERGSLWRLSPLSAEADLSARWPPQSLPARTLRVCLALIEQAAGRCTRADLGGLGLPPLPLQEGCKVVTPAHVSTLVWFNTESHSSPLDASWSCTRGLGVRVLDVLDTLCQQLKTGRIRSYWFPEVNLLEATGWPSEAWQQDASTIESLLRSLHSDTRPGVLQPLGPLGLSPEEALLTRWRHIVDAMAPPRVPRNSKPSGHYSPQQLQYISQLLHAMLRTSRPKSSSNTSSLLIKDLPEHIKDLLQITRHLLEQICQESSLVTKNAAETFLHRVKEESALHPDVTAIQDDAALVGHSFALLHIAADTDKALCSVIRPWLTLVSLSAHESTLHHLWLSGRRDELERESAALSLFGRSLSSCPNSGLALRFILDASSKGWLWARDLITTAQSLTQPLPLVLTPAPKKEVMFRIELAFSKKQMEFMTARSSKSLPRTINSSFQTEKLNKFRTLGPSSGRAIQSGTSIYDNTHPIDELTGRLQRWFYSNPSEPSFSVSTHVRLRDSSPMTLLAKAARTSHMHSGLGDVVQALVAMQRFSVLQELAGLLPDAEQAQALDVIRRLAREARRQHRRPNVALVPAKVSTTVQSQTVDLPPAPQGTYKPAQPNAAELSTLPSDNDPQRERILQRERALAAEVIKMRRDKESLLAACREVRRTTVSAPMHGVISHRLHSFAPIV